MLRAGSGEAPWAAIIQAIVAGEIDLFAVAGKRESIRYALAVMDITKFVDAVSRHLIRIKGGDHPEWIGNGTAAEMLSVTEAFIWCFRKTRPDLLPAHDNRYLPFKWEHVSTIARTYIFVPEVMTRAALVPRRAVGWLKASGLTPVFSLQPNKDFAFLRSEVEPLLVKHIDHQAGLTASLPIGEDDLRTRVVAAVAARASIIDTAESFDVKVRKAKR